MNFSIKRRAVSAVSPVSPDNFGYQDINSTIYKLVPSEQQMVVYQELRVNDTGELDIEGEVIIIV